LHESQERREREINGERERGGEREKTQREKELESV
jgi:hypothetical protein